MTLVQAITNAQTQARRDGNLDYRNVQPWQVYNKLSDEMKLAYEKTTLPRELLTLPVSQIQDYAERCGIEL